MTISRAQAKSSGHLFFFMLTVDQILGFRLVLGIILGEREGITAKAKFRRKLTPDGLLTFLPTYALHNRLLESSRYISRVLSTTLGMIC